MTATTNNNNAAANATMTAINNIRIEQAVRVFERYVPSKIYSPEERAAWEDNFAYALESMGMKVDNADIFGINGTINGHQINIRTAGGLKGWFTWPDERMFSMRIDGRVVMSRGKLATALTRCLAN